MSMTDAAPAPQAPQPDPAAPATGPASVPSAPDATTAGSSTGNTGAPDAPSGYTLARPALPDGLAWDEAFEQAALPVAHRLGLTPQQVQGLMEFYAGRQSQAHEEAVRGRHEAEAMSAASLRADWGSAYEVNLAQAARAARHFGGDALLKFLNDSGAGNNPDLIRTFARIGAMMGEQPLRAAQGGETSLEPADALREARRLMASPGYARRDHPEHTSLVDRVRSLFERAYADEAPG